MFAVLGSKTAVLDILEPGRWTSSIGLELPLEVPDAPGTPAIEGLDEDYRAIEDAAPRRAEEPAAKEEAAQQPAKEAAKQPAAEAVQQPPAEATQQPPAEAAQQPAESSAEPVLRSARAVVSRNSAPRVRTVQGDAVPSDLRYTSC